MANGRKQKSDQNLDELRLGPPPGAEEGPRNILVFSDGTGNSSAKLQKTNVWRCYEALDLGYPVAGQNRVQLAYYDNGVGTSSIKLLAILGGIFGWGLARNVKDIYKFLCRNYRAPDPSRGFEGDRIYAFGFSRGAYTIRLLVALVTRMGLASYNQNESELHRATNDNWREFRRGFHANFIFADFLVGLGRAMLRALLWLVRRGNYPCQVRIKRRWWLAEWWEHSSDKLKGFFTGTPPLREVEELGPEIEFVGVWDTVAAYGGPIVELTRAIDEWIWPLTMPDYRLSGKVKCARHALSIDDKRDSFHPLLWDEIYEKSRKDHDPANPRLQQVWFAGMHADVGGGYDDDSLSYVALWWMMEHAMLAGPGGAGVRFLPDAARRIELFRNVYGPIHNSRGGLGGFYRYQPRYINAWIDSRPGDEGKVLAASQIFRDPTIDHGRYRNHGLLQFPIRVHRSVEERLRMATDGYAPNNLPSRFVIDDGPRPLEASAARLLEGQELANYRAGLLQLADRIKLRRFWFFTSMALLLVLLAKPFWEHLPVLNRLVGMVDARTDTRVLEQTANAFVPSYARLWSGAFLADPYASLAAAGLLLGAVVLGLRQEAAMTNLSGRMWRQRYLPQPGSVTPPVPPRWPGSLAYALARQFHRNNGLARALAALKWRILPISLGAVIWAFNWYLASIVVTQLYLVPRETLGSHCIAAAQTAPGMAVADIADPCTNTGIKVLPGQTYSVTVTMQGLSGQSGWLDEGQPATPAGWTQRDGKNALTLAAARPLQRVTTGTLMQPVFELRRPLPHLPFQRTYMLMPRLSSTDGVRWTGELRFPPTGMKGDAATPQDLYFFVNDDVWPLDWWRSGKPSVKQGKDRPPVCVPPSGGLLVPFPLGGRYANNCGLAVITVSPLTPRATARQSHQAATGQLPAPLQHLPLPPRH